MSLAGTAKADVTDAAYDDLKAVIVELIEASLAEGLVEAVACPQPGEEPVISPKIPGPLIRYFPRTLQLLHHRELNELQETLRFEAASYAAALFLLQFKGYKRGKLKPSMFKDEGVGENKTPSECKRFLRGNRRKLVKHPLDVCEQGEAGENRYECRLALAIREHARGERARAEELVRQAVGLVIAQDLFGKEDGEPSVLIADAVSRFLEPESSSEQRFLPVSKQLRTISEMSPDAIKVAGKAWGLAQGAREFHVQLVDKSSDALALTQDVKLSQNEVEAVFAQTGSLYDQVSTAIRAAFCVGATEPTLRECLGVGDREVHIAFGDAEGGPVGVIAFVEAEPGPISFDRTQLETLRQMGRHFADVAPLLRALGRIGLDDADVPKLQKLANIEKSLVVLRSALKLRRTQDFLSLEPVATAVLELDTCKLVPAAAGARTYCEVAKKFSGKPVGPMAALLLEFQRGRLEQGIETVMDVFQPDMPCGEQSRIEVVVEGLSREESDEKKCRETVALRKMFRTLVAYIVQRRNGDLAAAGTRDAFRTAAVQYFKEIGRTKGLDRHAGAYFVYPKVNFRAEWSPAFDGPRWLPGFDWPNVMHEFGDGILRFGVHSSIVDPFWALAELFDPPGDGHQSKNRGLLFLAMVRPRLDLMASIPRISRQLSSFVGLSWSPVYRKDNRKRYRLIKLDGISENTFAISAGVRYSF